MAQVAGSDSITRFTDEDEVNVGDPVLGVRRMQFADGVSSGSGGQRQEVAPAKVSVVGSSL